MFNFVYTFISNPNTKQIQTHDPICSVTCFESMQFSCGLDSILYVLRQDSGTRFIAVLFIRSCLLSTVLPPCHSPSLSSTTPCLGLLHISGTISILPTSIFMSNRSKKKRIAESCHELREHTVLIDCTNESLVAYQLLGLASLHLLERYPLTPFAALSQVLTKISNVNDNKHNSDNIRTPPPRPHLRSPESSHKTFCPYSRDRKIVTACNLQQVQLLISRLELRARAP